MALLGKASFNRAGNIVLAALTVLLTMVSLIAWQAPGVQGRLTEYPSHPLGWYGWAMALFGVSVILVLLRNSGGGWLARLFAASVMAGVGLGALFIFHTSAWRLIDDHQDFASGDVTVSEQRLPISWARHDRTKRGFDYYLAYTPRPPFEFYLRQPDFELLRAGRAATLKARLPVGGRWCFKIGLEQGRRGAVRIVGLDDGRLPADSVVPCRAVG